MTVQPLILNIALLFTLSVVQQFIVRRWEAETPLRRVMSGMLFGLVAVIVMRTPLTLAPGVIFDGRSIILGIAGLFGGPVVALIASLMAAAYRVYLGGVGATMGVLVIAESALLGTIFGHFARQRRQLMRMFPLWVLGVAIHIIMIMLLGLLPGGLAETAVRQITLPVLTMYPVGFLLVAQTMIDQQERLERERALRESEERYRAIVHSAPFALYLYRLQNDELIFVTANPATDAMMGHSHTQLQGKPIEEAFPDLVPAGVPDIYRRIAREGGVWHVDAFPYDDGVAEGVYEVTAFGAGVGMVAAAITDVTKRIHEAEELQRYRVKLEDIVAERTRELEATNERLMEANEAKTRFLRSMSHELRTPLNAIIGFSDILRSGMAGDLGTEQRKQTDMINASGKHLLALINDVLDLSVIEARRIELRPSEFDATDLAETVVESLRPEAEAKGLRLESIVQSDGTLLTSDRLKVQQILLNLVGNAVKFTHSGSVTLTVSTPGASLVSFSVSDTGPGILPEHHGAIFEEFVQAEEEKDAAPKEGTGLGLAISSGLAQALGGILELESVPGQGSVFTLTLPRTLDLGAETEPDGERV